MVNDTVIIGSGISALTAAAILGKKGIRVHILEKKRTPGGSLKRFKRRGISFDVGFHYTGCLGDGEILSTIWRYCRTLDAIQILPFPADGSDRLYLQNRQTPIDAFFSYNRFIEELRRHFPDEQQAISTYFTRIQQICSTIPFYNTSLPLTEFLHDYRSSSDSVKRFLEGITSNSSLQSVLAAPCLLYGIPTDTVSMDVHAMVAHGYYQGAYGLAGGGQAVIDAFLSVCRTLGVTVTCSTEVSRIHIDSHGIRGVATASGEYIECSNVIYTGHPSLLIGLVEPKVFRPAYSKRLRALRNTFSMNVVFGTLEQPPSSLDWHNHIYLPAGADPLSKISSHINERLFMLTSTERTSNSLQGHSKSVILLQPGSWHETEEFESSSQGMRPPAYEAYKKTICDSMIKQAATLLGDRFGAIVPLAVGTPLTFRDELTAPEGCAYGARHSMDQYTPGVRTRVPGLFLGGQSTLMTGVVGASISGLVAAGHVVGLESLWKEIQVCN